MGVYGTIVSECPEATESNQWHEWSLWSTEKNLQGS